MAKKFTKKEIQALTEAGISFQVERDEIVVAKPYNGELRDGLGYEDIDHDVTDEQVEKVTSMFPNVGGFRTQWGGWHLRKDYPVRTHDFNDVSSPDHY